MLNYNLDQAKKLAYTENEALSIGERSEHSLHRIIKYLLDPTSLCHEQKIAGKVVDLYIDNHIYEIQTKAFNNLRNKLETLLPNYKVTIVYPCVIKKTITKFNEQGEILYTRNSPKKGKPLNCLLELYKIKFFLDNPNLSIKLICIDIDEYQQEVPRSRKNHHGRVRIDQVPSKINEVIDINKKEDYLKIIPYVQNEFKLNDYAKLMKVTKNQASYMFSVIRYLGLVEQTGKEGKAYTYKFK